jgi:hypothetical protein
MGYWFCEIPQLPSRRQTEEPYAIVSPELVDGPCLRSSATSRHVPPRIDRATSRSISRSAERRGCLLKCPPKYPNGSEKSVLGTGPKAAQRPICTWDTRGACRTIDSGHDRREARRARAPRRKTCQNPCALLFGLDYFSRAEGDLVGLLMIHDESHMSTRIHLDRQQPIETHRNENCAPQSPLRALTFPVLMVRGSSPHRLDAQANRHALSGAIPSLFKPEPPDRTVPLLLQWLGRR